MQKRDNCKNASNKRKKSEFNVFIYHDIKSWFLLFSILTETELIGPTVSRPWPFENEAQFSRPCVAEAIEWAENPGNTGWGVCTAVFGVSFVFEGVNELHCGRRL